MSEVQRQAFQNLTAKGLIDLESLGKGAVRQSSNGAAVLTQKFLPLFSTEEVQVGSFLTNAFVVADQDILTLRRNTGLRRIGA
jgi:hypothetical protein